MGRIALGADGDIVQNRAVDRGPDFRRGEETPAESSPEAALRFLDDVERTTRRILKWPTLLHPERGGSRRMLLGTFSFKVVYAAESEAIIMAAIAHTSRKPGYWKGRMESRPSSLTRL